MISLTCLVILALPGYRFHLILILPFGSYTLGLSLHFSENIQVFLCFQKIIAIFDDYLLERFWLQYFAKEEVLSRCPLKKERVKTAPGTHMGTVKSLLMLCIAVCSVAVVLKDDEFFRQMRERFLKKRENSAIASIRYWSDRDKYRSFVVPFPTSYRTISVPLLSHYRIQCKSPCLEAYG